MPAMAAGYRALPPGTSAKTETASELKKATRAAAARTCRMTAGPHPGHRGAPPI